MGKNTSVAFILPWTNAAFLFSKVITSLLLFQLLQATALVQRISRIYSTSSEFCFVYSRQQEGPLVIVLLCLSVLSSHSRSTPPHHLRRGKMNGKIPEFNFYGSESLRVIKLSHCPWLCCHSLKDRLCPFKRSKQQKRDSFSAKTKHKFWR